MINFVCPIGNILYSFIKFFRKMKKIVRYKLVVFLFICGSFFLNAQEISRPPVWGVAKMTFLVSNFELARDYFGEFLGFSEAFSYSSPLGKILSFKVNDRQYIEFIEDPDAKNKTRMVSYSLETDKLEQMRLYLKSKGVKVPDAVSLDGAGNEVILVHDPSGIALEFINYTKNGMHYASKGKYLSDQRISTRIHHAGLYTKSIMDKVPFYEGILGFTQTWRYPEDPNEEPMYLYLRIPDCVENIEHSLSKDPNVCHPCFVVNDMQEALYTLKERAGDRHQLAKPAIGRGKRWLLNISNEDKTRVEFTEPFTVR